MLPEVRSRDWLRGDTEEQSPHAAVAVSTWLLHVCTCGKAHVLPIPAEMCSSVSHSTRLSYTALQVWLSPLPVPGKDCHTSALQVASLQPNSLGKPCTKLLLQQLLRWLENPQSTFYVPGASLKSCLWDSAGLSGSTRGAEMDALCAHHMRTSLAQQSPW